MRRVYTNTKNNKVLRNKVTQEVRDMRKVLESDFPDLMGRIQSLLARGNKVVFDKKKNLNTVLTFLETGDVSPQMKREIQKTLASAQI